MGQDRILVLMEHENGGLAPISLKLLTVGKALAEGCSGVLCGCVMGRAPGDVSEETALYVDEVYTLDDANLSSYQADLYASALETLVKSVKPSVLLMNHSYENVELGPKVAHRFNSEFVPDCAEVEWGEEGRLLCTKPVYGGRAIAVIGVHGVPGVATMRCMTQEPLPRQGAEGRIIQFDVALDSSLARSETLSVVEGESVNLGGAEVIVSGGRGIGSVEGIEQLQKLIHLLHKRFGAVELGASRPLVDNGLLPHARQVGQTGERVSPQIYFAIGISGSTQHLTGMIGSRKIVAINQNDEAPIFGVSDYGVVGRYEEVLPGLMRKLEEMA